MERLSLQFYYQLGAQLGPVARANVTTALKGQVYFAALAIKPPLRALLDQVESLKTCRDDCERLLAAIEQMEREFNPQQLVEPVQPADFAFQSVAALAARFAPVLMADLNAQITYMVTQKAIYDTDELIEHAEHCLPESAQAVIGQAVADELCQAGRCLVLDLPTACGFHTFRALETVLHNYYVEVCKPANPSKKLSSWAAYLTELYKVEDEDVKKVYHLLYQMKGDRNDIMHPEMVLSADQALGAFETGKAAIIAMAGRLSG